ncbi:hypothetical protein HOLleu_06074 [Holothuria leucospilota]|uniref:Uncharacterized protein n=1 Tax=Holothuria leucospilota TaxID=206669 RepID=A0A9Q1CLK9_HOLLE|nr:hypothetical protein HOLleu_06074 [Holothuria leucospilota]
MLCVLLVYMLFIGIHVDHISIMFGPHLDGASLHARRQHEKNLVKLARTRSDIVFLSQCKRLDIVPQGLRIRNPLKGDRDRTAQIAENICKTAFPATSKSCHTEGLQVSKKGDPEFPT